MQERCLLFTKFKLHSNFTKKINFTLKTKYECSDQIIRSNENMKLMSIYKKHDIS